MTPPASSVDLGPGALTPQTGSPFFLASADWQAIQTYVAYGLDLQKITGILQELGMTKSLNLANQIIANCNNWNNVIYPEMIQLAGSLAAFGNSVPAAYTTLETVASTGTVTPVVQEAVGGLQSALSNYLPAASKALTDAQQFNTFCVQTATQIQQVIPSDSPVWSYAQQLLNVPPLNTLETAVGLLQGVWAALNNDLTYISGLLSNAQQASSLIAGLNLQVAISDWQNVASEAAAFVSSAQKTQTAAI